MYLSYNKLWKLLIDKGMNKTDLCHITGISTRTMAKLSKNESVTTDTLLSICKALSCDLSDIMETVHDDPGTSLYDAYTLAEVTEDEDGIFEVSLFEHKGRSVKVFKTIDRANRFTQIHCVGDEIVWKQFYPNGIPGNTYSLKCDKKIFGINMRDEGAVNVVVVSGKAYDIRGLDEGAFVSSRRVPTRQPYVYLMSEPVFKLFDPIHEFE